MSVTPNLSHRSQWQLLIHWAPASDFGVKTNIQIGVWYTYSGYKVFADLTSSVCIPTVIHLRNRRNKLLSPILRFSKRIIYSCSILSKRSTSCSHMNRCIWSLKTAQCLISTQSVMTAGDSSYNIDSIDFFIMIIYTHFSRRWKIPNLMMGYGLYRASYDHDSPFSG
jgi:hypothetical protein